LVTNPPKSQTSAGSITGVILLPWHWPISVDVALKEWASVITALESGRQIIPLRKGGILEQSNKTRNKGDTQDYLAPENNLGCPL
jgi:hypothetical protein